MSFCLRPNAIPLPFFGLKHFLLTRPIWIVKTTHLSKSGLYPEVLKIGNRACQGIGICSSKSNLMQKTAAFRSGEGERGMKVLAREELVDKDLKLRSADGGLKATLNRMSKWLVSCTFCTIVILRHDAEAMWVLLGSVLNITISIVLKRVLNHERPVSTISSDPGMPSSHAQSIFFIAVYIAVSTLESLGVSALTLIISTLVFAVGSCLCWLRVSQYCHTVSQVFVGALLGLLFSVLWLWSWNAVIRQAYVSYLLVRVCVALGAAGFSLAFAGYAFRYLLKERARNE